MDFVLALHTHLPYVLNHGRWPHGSDWLCEAAVETYLPLIEALEALEAEGTPTPVTIGITPILANQLASPDFVAELEAFFTQRLEASDEAAQSMRGTWDDGLVPLTDYWRERLLRLRALWRRDHCDLIGVFRGLAARGRIELMTSAATHGFLPLLLKDESIRLQLAVGKSEFKRLFGTEAKGIWVPECAYRPAGGWPPMHGIAQQGWRRGIEEHLADFGFDYFFTDAHMARAGAPLGLYGERYGGKPEQVIQSWEPGRPEQSPYRAYITTGAGTSHMVSAFVRDPRSSAQVWSRHGGYPGDPWYLEFHKTRWPGGLKFWRVSQQGADLGQKAPYEPLRAMKSASAQGKHFVDLLAEVSGREDHNVGPSGVIVAPFDTELFGHWWYEGPEFLAAAWRAMRHDGRVHGTTASEHLRAHHPTKGVQLAAGSWGKNGDWSMWFGHESAWTWPQLWRLEELFWGMAREALAHDEGRVVLAQAARAMLLAQSSDWQFILSTNEVADYGVRRFRGHVEDTEGLLGGLRHGLDTGEWAGVLEFVARLADRDKIFPDVLDAVRVALGEEQR